jgi:hypothetical protein
VAREAGAGGEDHPDRGSSPGRGHDRHGNLVGAAKAQHEAIFKSDIGLNQ